MGLDIIPTPQKNNDDWQAIVEQLQRELPTHELPNKVVQAMELMIAGWPTYKIAKKLNVSNGTVRKWLSDYPTMAVAVARGRELMSAWRMARLEQLFVDAVERTEEILNTSLDGISPGGDEVNPKVLPVIAAQARYIIGLFAGQITNIQVVHELGDTVLKAKQDAMDYIAQQLAAQRQGSDEEPIEAVYRIIDSKIDDSGPMLDEHGNPPFGQMGVLDTNDDGTLCHICGRRYKGLASHVINNHNTTTGDYEMLYLLPDGSLGKAKDQ